MTNNTLCLLKRASLPAKENQNLRLFAHPICATTYEKKYSFRKISACELQQAKGKTKTLKKEGNSVGASGNKECTCG